MGLFDGLLPELHESDDDVRVIRDRRGRLAMSRPSGRPKITTRKDPSHVSTTTEGAGAGVAVEKAKVTSKSSKESIKPPTSKKSKESLKTGWGPAEDVRLLELKRDGKSWEYIEGKLDDKGKDIAALKTRFEELTKPKDAAIEEENKDKVKEKKQENSPNKKGENKKGKGKTEESGAESDKTTKVSDSGSKKGNGILKSSPKGGKKEASSDEKGPKSENKAAEMAAYVGRNGRGEVRFFNGVPILYKHSGINAEPLEAEAVAILQKEAARYERNKWLMVVSRLFDKTGIRMDPEVARIALEGN